MRDKIELRSIEPKLLTKVNNIAYIWLDFAVFFSIFLSFFVISLCNHLQYYNSLISNSV